MRKDLWVGKLQGVQEPSRFEQVSSRCNPLLSDSWKKRPRKRFPILELNEDFLEKI